MRSAARADVVVVVVACAFASAASVGETENVASQDTRMPAADSWPAAPDRRSVVVVVAAAATAAAVAATAGHPSSPKSTRPQFWRPVANLVCTCCSAARRPVRSSATDSPRARSQNTPRAPRYHWLAAAAVVVAVTALVVVALGASHNHRRRTACRPRSRRPARAAVAVDSPDRRPNSR